MNTSPKTKLYKRSAANTIYQRLQENRKFIQVIIGPRQVGKTTAILQTLEEINFPSYYASADLPAPPTLNWLKIQWEIARNKLVNSKPLVLVLDEIQKIPHWSNEVKRLWDEDTRNQNKIHVVILGSSSLLMQKGLDESLAGRFELIHCSYWSWLECKNCFGWDLDQYIYFGGYPGAATLINDESRWRHYIQDSLIETIISKDILLLNRVEKPALLRRLFVLACEYGGQILAYQKIMGQLQDVGNTTTLAHYQQLLESAYLIKGLEKWSGQAIRRRSSSPKWLPLNTGLVTALSNKSFDEWHNDKAAWGRLVEMVVGNHLVNMAKHSASNIYYWREKDKEVDFVISKGNDLLAVEVKSGKNRLMTYPGLEAFMEKYPQAKPLLIGEEGMLLTDFLEKSSWFAG